jgi:hypothetical protein
LRWPLCLWLSECGFKQMLQLVHVLRLQNTFAIAPRANRRRPVATVLRRM